MIWEYFMYVLWRRQWHFFCNVSNTKKSEGEKNTRERSRGLFVNEHFSHIDAPKMGFTSARTQRGWKKKSWEEKKCTKRWVTGRKRAAAGRICVRRLCDAIPLSNNPPHAQHTHSYPLPVPLLGPNSGRHHRRRQLQQRKLHLSDWTSASELSVRCRTNRLIKASWIWKRCPLAKKKNTLVPRKISISQFHFNSIARLRAPCDITERIIALSTGVTLSLGVSGVKKVWGHWGLCQKHYASILFSLIMQSTNQYWYPHY